MGFKWNGTRSPYSVSFSFGGFCCSSRYICRFNYYSCCGAFIYVCSSRTSWRTSSHFSQRRSARQTQQIKSLSHNQQEKLAGPFLFLCRHLPSSRQLLSSRRLFSTYAVAKPICLVICQCSPTLQSTGPPASCACLRPVIFNVEAVEKPPKPPGPETIRSMANAYPGGSNAAIQAGA